MIRRVVTGQTETGKGTVSHDGQPPRFHRYEHVPGMANSLIWATRSPATPTADPTPAIERWIPAPGETIALTVTFPPDKVFMDPAFDGQAAIAEQLRTVPGLAETFEPDGMHMTPTIDYGVVLAGELLLDVDGDSTVLRAGDIIVQNRTRHTWRNLGEEPATVFFVMVGAEDS